jgi:hypothetical protein
MAGDGIDATVATLLSQTLEAGKRIRRRHIGITDPAVRGEMTKIRSERPEGKNGLRMIAVKHSIT